MKVLSIKEPFASLIKEGYKKIETRSFKTNYRGEIYVHASIKKVTESYEDNKILVFLDINPVSPGHALIIPKEHTLDVMSIDNDTLIKIINKSRDIASLLINKLGATGFTLTQNNGAVQEVKHFHLHLIPYYENKVINDVDEVYKRIMDK